VIPIRYDMTGRDNDITSVFPALADDIIVPKVPTILSASSYNASPLRIVGIVGLVQLSYLRRDEHPFTGAI